MKVGNIAHKTKDRIITVRNKVLGQGAYGKVYAISLIQNGTIDDDLVLKRNIGEGTASFHINFRELSIVKLLQGHPHIVSILKIKYSGDNETRDNIFSPLKSLERRDDNMHFIFEKADIDLERMIHQYELSENYIIHFLVQILLALEYMHQMNVIHRDLKPSNILYFEEQKIIKLADFGLSIISYDEPRTPSVSTVFYRAPEMNEEYHHGVTISYGPKVDIWSLGCIFYEMITCEPLFNVGERNRRLAMRNLAQKHDKFLSNPRDFINNIDSKLDEGWNVDTLKLMKDLMLKMLLPEDKRFTASQALSHPLITSHKEYKKHIDTLRRRLLIPDVGSIPLQLRYSDVRGNLNVERKKVYNYAIEMLTRFNQNSSPFHPLVDLGRIIYHALDLYDKITLDPQNQKLLTSTITVIELFELCMYIFYKFSCTLVQIMGYERFTTLIRGLPVNKIRLRVLLSEGTSIEEMIIEILSSQIYYVTLYEMRYIMHLEREQSMNSNLIDEERKHDHQLIGEEQNQILSDEEEQLSLLELLRDMDCNNMTLEDIYRRYLSVLVDSKAR